LLSFKAIKKIGEIKWKMPNAESEPRNALCLGMECAEGRHPHV